jgi:hypothetical protein
VWSEIAVKQSRRGGCAEGCTAARLLTLHVYHENECQNLIFYVLYETKKLSQDISAGIGVVFLYEK